MKLDYRLLVVVMVVGVVLIFLAVKYRTHCYFLLWRPGLPTNIFCEWQDACVVIHWSTVSNANAYEVLYRDCHHQPDWCVIPNVFGTSYSLPISNGLHYVISVRAINAYGSRQSHETRNGRSRASAPANFTASYDDRTGRLIRLGWKAVTNGKGYQLQQRTVGEGITTSGTIWSTDKPQATHTVDNTFVYGTRYEYAVFSVDEAGQSKGSNAIIMRPRVPAPTDLLALRHQFTSHRVTLKWKTVEKSKGYVVQRKKLNTSEEFCTIRKILISSLTATEDASLELGVKYAYVIRSLDNAGESKPSNEVIFHSRAPAPTNLTISYDDKVADSIVLQWKPSLEASGYIVQRAASKHGKGFSTLKTINDSSVMEINDNSFVYGTIYEYAIMAVDVVGPSQRSEVVSILPRAPAPTNLTASYNRCKGHLICLQWKPVSKAIGYSIQRKEKNLPENTSIVKVINKSSIVEAEDSRFELGVIYSYVVTSTDHAGESQPSNEVTICPRALAGTSLMVFRDESTAHAIVLQWIPLLEATGYAVKRALNKPGAEYMIIETVTGPSITETKDRSFDNGISYKYVVFSVHPNGSSEWSKEVCFCPRILAPTNLKLLYDECATRTVVLQWKPVAKTEGYVIERVTISVDGKTVSTRRVNLKSSIKKFNDTALIHGFTYEYVIIALDHAGPSEPSKSVSICYRIPPPTCLKATFDEQMGNAILLEWRKESKSSGYIVRRATEWPSTELWTVMTLSDPSITTVKDTTFIFGVTYYYVVFSIDGAGESRHSNAVKINTRAPQPTGVCVRYNEGLTPSISVYWRPIALVNSYLVHRVAGNLGEDKPTTWIVTDPSTSAIKDTSFIYGYTYYYAVTSRDESGESNRSTEVSICPRAPPPEMFKADTPPNTSGTVALSWEPVPRCRGYTIYRKPLETAMSSARDRESESETRTKLCRNQSSLDINQLPFAADDARVIATIDNPMICSYADACAQNGIEYLYAIKSLDAKEEHGHLTATIGRAVLPSPNEFSVEPLNDQGMIFLSWNRIVGASGYRIERQSSSVVGRWITISRPAGVTNKYVDSNELSSHTAYNYKIYAFDALNESLPSLYPESVMLLATQQEESVDAIDIRFGNLVTAQVRW